MGAVECRSICTQRAPCCATHALTGSRPLVMVSVQGLHVECVPSPRSCSGRGDGVVHGRLKPAPLLGTIWYIVQLRQGGVLATCAMGQWELVVRVWLQAVGLA